ncbi:2-C-methyl-D-erythritol 4-phosphate cytidylyltransferase [Arthrobacter sunyaminii]|uniref:2-C-methyl-D-erythritol 4-phosphate cytidylyltransferase n=1 Tax=Arthrobacter sunyaminii TaxID=2816859 RepID=UPI001A949A82|nr:2-C-methyl-D-erythritol 4-phosphate cytidylyltransferase [Arthrobacter sunyaminii]MBO0909858.1 2-C-methyl-D-erythritol 4-phosphate cytidylyltransferase [Arthrobacter sunyaminii]
MPTTTSSRQRIGVILVAGGSGQRLGYGIPKAQVPLSGVALLTRALRGVEASGVAAAVSVAVPSGDTVLRSLCAEAGMSVPLAVVDGGETRAHSVRAALRALPADIDSVLVHDAARPLTPPEVFHRVAAALAAGAEAVIPAVPVTDTIKSTAPTAPGQAGIASRTVTGTPDRSALRAVQTPQGFDAALLCSAHSAAESFDAAQAAAVTDDAMLVESLGAVVYVVEGSQTSLKITTPLDLLLAEAVLAQEQNRLED